MRLQFGPVSGYPQVVLGELLGDLVIDGVGVGPRMHECTSKNETLAILPMLDIIAGSFMKMVLREVPGVIDDGADGVQLDLAQGRLEEVSPMPDVMQGGEVSRW